MYIVLQKLPTEMCRFWIFSLEKHFTKHFVFLQKETSACLSDKTAS